MAFAHPFYGVVKSTLVRPSNTSAYAQNDLIASSTTAGSISVPSFTLPRDDTEVAEITRGVLYTSLVSGFTTFQGRVDLWDAPPTFTNGDNGAYAVATGSAHWLGEMTSQVSNAYLAGADGGHVRLLPGPSGTVPGEIIMWARAPGDKLYWSLQEIDSTGFTPASGETFTLALDLIQR